MKLNDYNISNEIGDCPLANLMESDPAPFWNYFSDGKIFIFLVYVDFFNDLFIVSLRSILARCQWCNNDRKIQNRKSKRN